MLALEWHDDRLAVSEGAPGASSVDAASGATGSSSSVVRPDTGLDPAVPSQTSASTALVTISNSGTSSDAVLAPELFPLNASSPYKHLLYLTTAPVLLSVLASSVSRLAPKEILLLHLAGQGHWALPSSATAPSSTTVPPGSQKRETPSVPSLSTELVSESIRQQLASSHLSGLHSTAASAGVELPLGTISSPPSSLGPPSALTVSEQAPIAAEATSLMAGSSGLPGGSRSAADAERCGI